MALIITDYPTENCIIDSLIMQFIGKSVINRATMSLKPKTDITKSPHRDTSGPTKITHVKFLGKKWPLII